MRLIAYAIIGIIGLASIICMFFEVYRCFYRPAHYYLGHHDGYRRGWNKRWPWSITGAACVGVGICIFEGCKAVLFWLPNAWIFEVSVVLGMIALFGGAFIIGSMEEFNRRFMEGEITRDGLRDAHERMVINKRH